MFIVGFVIFMINFLSKVLIPFFVAWALAYLNYPIVKFIQYKLRVKNRPVAILLTLLLIILFISLFMLSIIPPMVEEVTKLSEYVNTFIKAHTHSDNVTIYIQEWLRDNRSEIERFFHENDMTAAAKAVMPQLWSVVTHTYRAFIVMGIALLTLLYTFFILLDYEYLTENWTKIFPKHLRPFWNNVGKDVEHAMNSYIRGQSLVALSMGILFIIGFLIIDFPMAIGLGILIGLMDLVPYLHTFALIPTAFLALMKAADTGDNFFLIFGSAIAVFCIVQVIIDMVITPKIMGKAMGLNPAILLLSLSIWGALLGFIGLIIALPMTTLLMAYYKRYITREDEGEKGNSEPPSDNDGKTGE